jgi:hypothetical protein
LKGLAALGNGKDLFKQFIGYGNQGDSVGFALGT